MERATESIKIHLKTDEVLCLAGDENNDLYFIESGKLLVCLTKGTQVTPLAYLGQGECLGELSFFDRKPRSANVIAVEDSVIMIFPAAKAQEYFPRWTLTLAKFMTKRIRHTDEIIRAKGIKKSNVNAIRPLNMQEQGHFFKLLKEHKAS